MKLDGSAALVVVEVGLGVCVGWTPLRLDRGPVAFLETHVASWARVQASATYSPSPQVRQSLQTTSLSPSGPQAPTAKVTPSAQVLQAWQMVS